MSYDFDQVKSDFMKIQNGSEWNALKDKYSEFRFSDMDHEMKAHMNKIMKEMATQEQKNNPGIHYEIKKTTSQK